MSRVVVPPSVAPVLRKGLIDELTRAADELGRLTAPGYLEESPNECRIAWQQINALHSLLGQVGVVGRKPEQPIELELGEYATTAYEVVKHRYDQATQAVQDAEHDSRLEPVIDPHLEAVVDGLRREIQRSSSGLGDGVK